MDLEKIIQEAILEDMPDGDLTTDSLGVESKPGRAKLIAKEDLILSGVIVFERTVLKLDPISKFTWYFKDSDLILKGQTIAIVEGNLIQILKAERIALNFIGHLSGIATYTRCFVKQLGKSKTKILDTRKTTPVLRALEKQAVLHGGGTNHRKNLSEAILVKNNHISLMGGMTNAISAIKRVTKKPIEVEARTVNEVKEAIELNVNRILLDNFKDSDLSEVLKLIPKHIETEASGNMTVERLKQIADLGLTYVSVGAITHSAPVADISLHFDWSK